MCIENGRQWQCQKLCKVPKAHLPLGSLIVLDMYNVYTSSSCAKSEASLAWKCIHAFISTFLWHKYWNGGGFLLQMIRMWQSVLKMAGDLHLSFSKDLDLTPWHWLKMIKTSIHAERILHRQRRKLFFLGKSHAVAVCPIVCWLLARAHGILLRLLTTFPVIPIKTSQGMEDSKYWKTEPGSHPYFHLFTGDQPTKSSPLWGSRLSFSG